MRYTSGASHTTYRYTGQREESSFGLYYYNARWYDPQLGRFAQADTIVPGGVQGLDRYAYVNNNPVKYNDPSGHDAGFTQYLSAAECLDKSAYTTEAKKEISTALKNYHYEQTLTGKAKRGDMGALIDLVTPSHGGVRGQIEVSVDLGISLSGSIGVNVVYNRLSDESAMNVDWALEPGLGVGGGVSATGGFLCGWGSSSVEDATKGYSYIIGGTAAAEGAISIAVTAPMAANGKPYVDPYTGQVPITVFGGGGAGGAYGGIGGGINGPTGIYSNLTPLLPWHWNR